ncbi:MAG: metal ABC transporter permease [Phycisphaeraceae bacterium]|nr:metal ABC transporter permease [Phycisphaeraceae bacterium]
MISSFLDSWQTFAPTYLASIGLATLLGALGVPMMARDQVFLGAAAAQCATFGVALVMGLSAGLFGVSVGLLSSPAATTVAALLFATGATLLMSRREGWMRQTPESLTGLVFLAASALTALLLINSPFALRDAQQRMLSSATTAGWAEAGIAIVAALVVFGALLSRRDAIALLLLDPATAVASGLRVRAWNVAHATALGLAVGLSVGVAGLLFTLGALVLPAMIGRAACRTTTGMLVFAPLAGGVVAGIGSFVSHALDLPMGSTIVALLVIATPAALLVRSGRGFVVRE